MKFFLKLSLYVVREAKKRELGLCLFYVEMVGAMVLHHCMISEMKIGKGKTLAVAIAVYLSTLEGKGVHVHEHFPWSFGWN